jgi:hypothetical protein
MPTDETDDHRENGAEALLSAMAMIGVSDRPIAKAMTPEENEEFLRKQATYEAAYHRTGEPLVLWDAFMHVQWARQTIPLWLAVPLFLALTEQRTDQQARRYRERMYHVQRYLSVSGLRRKHTKDKALDLAVHALRGSPAGCVDRQQIEASYDLVRRDLLRQGQESEFFYLVDKWDAMTPRSWGKLRRKEDP